MRRNRCLRLLVLCLAAVPALAGCGASSESTAVDPGLIGLPPLDGPTGATGMMGPEGTSKPPRIHPIPPRLVTATDLKREATALGQPIYWAGPRRGFAYEFRRTSPYGELYVRYLPRGVAAGAPGTRFLTVATYYWGGSEDPRSVIPDAFRALQGPGTFAGANGSIAYIDPRNRKSVLLAFRHSAYEVEIHGHRQAVALRTAESGRVRPVR